MVSLGTISDKGLTKRREVWSVEVELADLAPERGLGELDDGERQVDDAVRSTLGIDHFGIEHAIDADLDVVARDALLLWNVDHVALGPAPTDRDDGRSLWWRHERLQRRVLRDPARWHALLGEIHTIESRWLEAPPPSADAFAEADAFLEAWTKRTAEPGPDRRPWWARRY